MTGLSAAQIAGAFIAGLVVLGMVAMLTKPLWMPLWVIFHRTQQFLEDWFGEPARPGQPARPGAMERLAQLEHNGGSSMRDQIHRIEEQIEKVQETATQAVTAAGLAVNESKVTRSILAEADSRNVADLTRTKDLVQLLTAQMTVAQAHAHEKEVAYVRALQALGIDLTQVADAVLHDPSPQEH